MEELWLRLVQDMADRVSGPLRFRLLLQPLMAAFFAIRSGRRDAREGKPPYFWALATSPGHRREMVLQGWKDVRNVFLIALVLDVVYQVVVAGFVYPGEAVLVAFALAIVPYLVLRGVVNRLFRP